MEADASESSRHHEVATIRALGGSDAAMDFGTITLYQLWLSAKATLHALHMHLKEEMHTKKSLVICHEAVSSHATEGMLAQLPLNPLSGLKGEYQN